MATTISVRDDGLYEPDRPHSAVQFGARHVGVSSFRASFGELEARFVAEGGVAIDFTMSR